MVLPHVRGHFAPGGLPGEVDAQKGAHSPGQRPGKPPRRLPYWGDPAPSVTYVFPSRTSSKSLPSAPAALKSSSRASWKPASARVTACRRTPRPRRPDPPRRGASPGFSPAACPASAQEVPDPLQLRAGLRQPLLSVLDRAAVVRGEQVQAERDGIELLAHVAPR